MGRKKTAKRRKVDGDEAAEPDDDDDDEPLVDSTTESATPTVDAAGADMSVKQQQPDHDETNKETASNYAIKTHSAEIFDSHIYVSDGSEDEDDQVEFVLMGSRMGVMRRGIHHPGMLVQQNRQWVKPTTDNDQSKSNDGHDNPNDADETAATTQIIDAQAAAAAAEEQRLADELASLDPAQRAARLLQEKQRKLEQAKELARRLESQENAGRDPSQFSKRTAFDIRFDQIEDKPWERGVGDLTDFFNYGLTEEEWLEYGQQQLAIRQELTDAHYFKRAIDPNIVPVIPKKPSSDTTANAAVVDAANGANDSPDGTELGPTFQKDTKENPTSVPSLATADLTEEEKQKYYNIDVGFSGAWGAGSSSDAKLAQLMEEQERGQAGSASDHGGYGDRSHNQDYPKDVAMAEDYQYGNQQDYYPRGGGGQEWSDSGGRALPPPPPPPPPPHFRDRGFAGRFDGRGRGGRSGGRFQSWDGGRGGGYEQRGGGWR